MAIVNRMAIGEFKFELDRSLAFQVAQLVRAPRWAPDVVTFIQDKRITRPRGTSQIFLKHMRLQKT